MKKRILGITVLLAVLAMCVTFTACVVDQDERSVTFINTTKSRIEIVFKNAPSISIDPLPSVSTPDADAPRNTAKKKGEDLILKTIVFTIAGATLDHVVFEGAVEAEVVKDGISMSYGTIIIRPKTGPDYLANPVAFLKFGSIPLDD